MDEIINNVTPAVEAEGLPEDEVRAQRNAKFKQQVEVTKLYRRKLIRDWQVNIDYRRGKPYASQSDEDRIAVPLDWTLTKDKQAALFSQCAAVRISHPPQSMAKDVAPWLHSFENKVNDMLIAAGVEAVMDECLPNCINAAGFAAAIVAREALTEEVQVPAIDFATMPPEIAQMIQESGTMPDGSEIPMETVPREIDSRYTITSVSPEDFLWPLSFSFSDFDKAPWLGRSGRVPWATAAQRFGLKDEEKRKVVGDDRTVTDRVDRLRSESERNLAENEDLVSFDEIFYWEQAYDTSARNFSLIHHLVFVHGKEKPVIDEPWKGQRFDEESGQLIGVLKFPIRVLTLAYITGDAIPPSDSAVSRPSIDEINKTRNQMMQQRKHSMPVRWINPDRVPPEILYTLMRGTWQGMVPIQGGGQNAVGELPRAAMPQETYALDRIAKQDATEAWGAGASLRNAITETKGETDATEANIDSRMSKERARVGAFYTSLAEVIGGLISIFEDPQTFGEGYSALISRSLCYSILADSTVLLDSNAKLKRLMGFVNFTAKSGLVDLEPVLREIATLSGLDPNLVIVPAKPAPPVEPNISLRLTGTEDMMNPLTLAFLINAGQAPSVELIEKAKALIQASVTPPEGLQAPQPGDMGATLPMLPEGVPPGGAPPMPPIVPPVPQPLPAPELPPPPPPAVGAAHPNFGPMNRVNRRVTGDEE